MITAHTDVVGSLLRPPELLRARDQLQAGTIAPADFKRIEDRAVDAAVALQENAGIDVITDGEMRRLSFQSALTDAVDGVGEVTLDAFLWGEWHSETFGDKSIARPSQLGVTGKLKRRRPLAAEDFTLSAGAGDEDTEGHADQPEPVCQSVVEGAFQLDLSDAGFVPR